MPLLVVAAAVVDEESTRCALWKPLRSAGRPGMFWYLKSTAVPAGGVVLEVVKVALVPLFV